MPHNNSSPVPEMHIVVDEARNLDYFAGFLSVGWDLILREDLVPWYQMDLYN
jgi:hypothetical protein